MLVCLGQVYPVWGGKTKPVITPMISKYRGQKNCRTYLLVLESFSWENGAKGKKVVLRY